MLQIDNEIMKTGYYATNTEDSIYGVCPVAYDLIPEDKDLVKLIKTMDPSSCSQKYEKYRHVNSLTADNIREYYLRRREEDLLIESIRASSNILLQSQKVATGFVKSVQTFTLVGESDIEMKLEVEGVLVKSLGYIEPRLTCQKSAMESLFDVTGGRENYDASDLSKFLNFLHFNEKILIKILLQLRKLIYKWMS